MSSSPTTDTPAARLPDDDQKHFAASPGAPRYQNSSHGTLPPERLSNLVKDVYSIYQIPPTSEEWPRRMRSFSESLTSYDLYNDIARQLTNDVLRTVLTTEPLAPFLSEDESMMKVIDDVERSFKSHRSWDAEVARTFDELRSNLMREVISGKDKRSGIEHEFESVQSEDGVDPNMDFIQRLSDLFDDHEASTPGSVSDLGSRSGLVAVSAIGLAIAAYSISHRD
ncbi:hypothetical protein I302_108221 [Kwoniella bestiolae CBS 10118]|uniref:Uncharacterized protein n=1 Tax=Kwoniella bestiolae CBS 10118 TaxID=1296100 RepID=A0A1B9FWC3_9TREE|nr:hypothetical protein I302_07414 [Kwoniella bestiolae CBS 10118]OCF23063.1 hypothetical protein I302_07414 [Kwoniella bestiolae CBS 10118]